MLRMLTRSRKNIVSLGLSWDPCHLGAWKGDGVLVSLLQGNADMKAKTLPGCLTWKAQRQNCCRTEDRVVELRKQDQSWIWAERHSAGVNWSFLLLWHKAKNVNPVVTGHPRPPVGELRLTRFASFYLQGSMKSDSCFRISWRVNFQIRYG